MYVELPLFPVLLWFKIRGVWKSSARGFNQIVPVPKTFLIEGFLWSAGVATQDKMNPCHSIPRSGELFEAQEAACGSSAAYGSEEGILALGFLGCRFGTHCLGTEDSSFLLLELVLCGALEDEKFIGPK